MGDARFDPHLARVRESKDRIETLRSMADDEVVAALGGASRLGDTYLANVLTTEVLNRLRRQQAAASALQESEERYRLLVELSPEAIAVHVDGTLRFLNAAGASLLGANSAEALVGRPVIEFVHPDSRPLVAERMRRLLVGGVRALPLERERLLRVDGTPFDADVRAWVIPFGGEKAVQLTLREARDKD